MYESTKGAPHQKNYTKLSLWKISISVNLSTNFNSPWWQGHLEGFLKISQKQRQFSDGQQEFMYLRTLAKSGVRVS